jgi:hypothetical protein
MEDKFNDKQQDLNSKIEIQRKNKISLPALALILDFSPILFILLSSLLGDFMSTFALLSIVLFPAAGVITGVSALTKGKATISPNEKAVAVIAVVLPLIPVALTIIFYFGAVTGWISLM